MDPPSHHWRIIAWPAKLDPEGALSSPEAGETPRERGLESGVGEFPNVTFNSANLWAMTVGKLGWLANCVNRPRSSSTVPSVSCLNSLRIACSSPLRRCHCSRHRRAIGRRWLRSCRSSRPRLAVRWWISCSNSREAYTNKAPVEPQQIPAPQAPFPAPAVEA